MVIVDRQGKRSKVHLLDVKTLAAHSDKEPLEARVAYLAAALNRTDVDAVVIEFEGWLGTWVADLSIARALGTHRGSFDNSFGWHQQEATP